MRILSFIFIFIFIFIFSSASEAQIVINCYQDLSLGTFISSIGLNSAEDSGYSRFGISSWVGNEGICDITGDENTSVTITLNSNNSNLNLNSLGSSLGIILRLENSNDVGLGTSTQMTFSAGNLLKSIYVDASVPSSPSTISGDPHSNSIIINVSLD